ncbi:adenylate/guanylate cyclase domain-containing protein [Nocardioides marmoribigeumensis]|uniref:Class 3 adenylate cyclase/tetratricopeptide (TPR) repeat protein/predicted RNA-binding Zn-ribbon protein involved in translation (DUF1610 family) n=1 Tax=Nocardioides marmoribigeumensis TaxID=433649 RepID=A0ABU2BRD6_9ACTN|nr:adenylate/guanylate cyclase domain-containing protein [Nocardioides marmoribigeumensis]MDR7361173.1 class 3 adenylate cyclase/tetratricopeptide (TPR) repeat protein/predicted RNA-binding Zn-ribbon protein involved in translation (DUF1610 family) [Nocardioides marmoribigeumensis]
MTGCAGCGIQLADGARFCPACGTPVARACASCGATLVAPYRFCMECGTPQAGAPPAAVPDGVSTTTRRQASVLFADLVGFTTLSESRDTEDVRDLLSRYFEECRAVIGRYGGQVEKFIGDAVMAVWGADVSHEDDAERAVRAGLELVATVAGFAEDVGAPDLALRVGVVTDQVAVDVGAVAQGGQGMVAGDPVNTAARVQAAASPGSVWVDETTRRLTSAAVAYADTGLHELKGKAEPVRLHAATAVVAAIGGAQRADGLEAPLVGRARELRVVKELFHSAEETRSPVLVVVAGEAGVGKTRLGWEFEKYVDGLSLTTRWHSGRCLSYGEGVSFYALAEAVRGRLLTLVDPDEPQPTEQTLVERAVARWVPTEERDWMRARLAALLGQGSAGTGLTKEDLFIAWAAFFRHVGDGDSVTLVVDDAQHADDGLLAFVEYLLTTVDFPLFVVLMTRPDLLARAHDVVTHPRAHLVNLPTLGTDDMVALVDGLVPGLPARLRAQLVERAEGIPLYAVETVRALVDRDLVIPRDGVYAPVDPSTADTLDLESLGVPASLHAMVAARLDRLTVEQRTVVERASVLGLSFTPDAVVALCSDAGLERATTEAALTALVRSQVLARETSRLSSEQGNFRFVQAIVRQVAYDTLSRRDRKRLHLAAVAHLESHGLDGDDTAAVRAQHHLEALAASGADDADAAMLRSSAVDLLVLAADRAVKVGAPGEAMRHVAAALDLLPDDATSSPADADVVRRRAELHLRTAAAASVVGDLEAVSRHGRRSIELFELLDDSVGAALAATEVATGLGKEGDDRAGAALGEEWWDRLQSLPDSARVPEARLGLSFAISMDLTPREALWTGLTWRLVHCERTAHHAELSKTLARMAMLSSRLGAGSHAHDLFASAVRHARMGHDPRSLAYLLANLAGQDCTYDLPAATERATEAVEVARRCGDRFMVELAEANLAIAAWSAGAWDLTRLEDAPVGLLAAIGVLVHVATGRPTDGSSPPPIPAETSRQIWATFAHALWHEWEGRPEECLAQAREVVALHLDWIGVEDDFVHFFAHLARLAWSVGDDETLGWLVQPVDGAGDAVPLGLRAHRRHVAGLVADRDGEIEAAEAAYGEAIELFGRWGAIPAEARAHADLGVLLTRLGRGEEAGPHLTQAREVFDRLGAAAWAAELDAALGSPAASDPVPASP